MVHVAGCNYRNRVPMGEMWVRCLALSPSMYLSDIQRYTIWVGWVE